MTEFHVEVAYVRPGLTDAQLTEITEAVGGVVQYGTEDGILTMATIIEAEDGRGANDAAGGWEAGLAGVPHIGEAVLMGPVRFTIERADQRARRMPIIGTSEVAGLLGVSKQRVHQLQAEDPRFPKPVAVLTAGDIYRTGDVLAYIEGRRPAGRPPRAAA